MVLEAQGAVLLVDKATGPTSHDVVAGVRRAAKTRRVGHAGTLDPAASGLLLIGVGPATRLLTHLVGLDKRYSATIRLGVATSTDDAEGETTWGAPADAVPDAAIAAGIAALSGEIAQVPSRVSAIKVDGRRAYERVRAGEEPELAARAVTVSTFELLATRRDARAGTVDLDVVVEVSSGTYVRALARDLGDALGLGGHLTALRRQCVGPFLVEDAVQLEGVQASLESTGSAALLTPAAAAARILPSVSADATTVAALRQGKRPALLPPDAPLASVSRLAVLDEAGELVGIASTDAGVARVLFNMASAT